MTFSTRNNTVKDKNFKRKVEEIKKKRAKATQDCSRPVSTTMQDSFEFSN
jgi:hypothetical protein